MKPLLIALFAISYEGDHQRDLARAQLQEWVTTGMWLEHGSTGSPVVPPDEMRRKLKDVLRALDVPDLY